MSFALLSIPRLIPGVWNRVIKHLTGVILMQKHIANGRLHGKLKQPEAPMAFFVRVCVGLHCREVDQIRRLVNAMKEDVWVACLAEKDAEDRLRERQAEKRSHTTVYGLMS